MELSKIDGERPSRPPPSRPRPPPPPLPARLPPPTSRLLSSSIPVVALFTQPHLQKPKQEEKGKGKEEEEEELSLPGFATAAGAASSPFASLPALCAPTERQIRAAARGNAAAASAAAAEATESGKKRKESDENGVEGEGEEGKEEGAKRRSFFSVPVVLTAADRREQQQQRFPSSSSSSSSSLPDTHQQLVEPGSAAFLLALKRALRVAVAAADAPAVSSLLRLAAQEHSPSSSSTPGIAALLASRVGAVVAGLEAVRGRKRVFPLLSFFRFVFRSLFLTSDFIKKNKNSKKTQKNSTPSPRSLWPPPPSPTAGAPPSSASSRRCPSGSGSARSTSSKSGAGWRGSGGRRRRRRGGRKKGGRQSPLLPLLEGFDFSLARSLSLPLFV